jgi:hypothetical protein
VQKRLAEIGQEVVPPDRRTPQALAAHHKDEIEKWAPMIKAANVKADKLTIATTPRPERPRGSRVPRAAV